MVNLGKLIATGRTAEVYQYEEGKVLKLFFLDIPQSWSDREANLGHYIQETQLPVPKVFEKVKVNNREGMVFEKIEGPSILVSLRHMPWKAMQYARLLAILHAQVHEIAAPPFLETQRDWAREGILETNKLSKDVKERVLNLLDSLPDGDRLCHGDFHPGNIIVTRRGPVIIDWMTASRGTPSGDVACSSVVMEVAKPLEGTPMRWLLELQRRSFLTTYLKTYFQLRPLEKNSYVAWCTIMAANFLPSSISEEEKELMRIIESGLRATGG